MSIHRKAKTLALVALVAALAACDPTTYRMPALREATRPTKGRDVTDKTSTEETDAELPRDTCFTCCVSPTFRERDGWRQAIDALRDDGRLLKWVQDNISQDVFINLKRRDLFADYLASITPEGMRHD